MEEDHRTLDSRYLQQITRNSGNQVGLCKYLGTYLTALATTLNTTFNYNNYHPRPNILIIFWELGSPIRYFSPGRPGQLRKWETILGLCILLDCCTKNKIHGLESSKYKYAILRLVTCQYSIGTILPSRYSLHTSKVTWSLQATMKYQIP